MGQKWLGQGQAFCCGCQSARSHIHVGAVDCHVPSLDRFPVAGALLCAYFELLCAGKRKLFFDSVDSRSELRYGFKRVVAGHVDDSALVGGRCQVLLIEAEAGVAGLARFATLAGSLLERCVGISHGVSLTHGCLKLVWGKGGGSTPSLDRVILIISKCLRPPHLV